MPGAPDIWIVNLAACQARLIALEQDCHLLTGIETSRAAAMTAPGHRDRWIAAHVALHLALADHIGRRVEFVIESGGKPRVVDWAGDFSLAHSGDFALIAATVNGRIGIDVEVRRPIRMSERRRTLIEAAGEAVLPAGVLPAGDPDMRFLTAWTRLEAIAKLRGTGIGALLEDIGIVARGPGADVVQEAARRLVRDAVPPISLIPIALGSSDAVAALAIEAEQPMSPTLRDFGLELDRLIG